jgi:putative hydrolase of the HAD superfamily
VEEAEQRARLALDRGFRPGASTESQDTARRYMKDLLAHLAITDDAEVEAVARWRRSFNPPLGVWNQADPAAAAALRAVARAGLVAGVVSNSNGSIRDVLESTGLARHLAFVIDSAVVGVEKPDPRIFALALAAARVSAAEAVYVGDLYSVDVLGARAAGIDAVLIDPRGFWGTRDCPTARDAADAVRLILDGARSAG